MSALVKDMRTKAIKDEAAQLIEEFGSGAYGKAREAMREARRRGHPKLERYFAKVAVAIADRAGKEIGLDTGTRYLTDV